MRNVWGGRERNKEREGLFYLDATAALQNLAELSGRKRGERKARELAWLFDLLSKFASFLEERKSN